MYTGKVTYLGVGNPICVLPVIWSPHFLDTKPQTMYYGEFKPRQKRHIDYQDTLIRSQKWPHLGVPLYHISTSDHDRPGHPTTHKVHNTSVMVLMSHTFVFTLGGGGGGGGGDIYK